MIGLQTLRNLALGVCILCAVGGVIQIFWPENSYKPVINTVLVLYIITSVLQMRGTETWRMPEFAPSDFSDGLEEADYEQYIAGLSQEASEQALQSLLQEQGIDAEVVVEDGLCRVTVPSEENIEAAETVLHDNCGTLPYEVVPGGDEP